ncbi:MAG TPA: hypothetical protein VNY52_00860, partial [Solirubrobacteraceae bacterium]|nr:hypothetical protein [Solirubrobacteraceae bacterium]
MCDPALDDACIVGPVGACADPELHNQRRGFVEPRISTATTLGGAVAGIGFDGRGLGEGGVSLISTYQCNAQGDDQRSQDDDQRKDLDRQQNDRTA